MPSNPRPISVQNTPSSPSLPRGPLASNNVPSASPAGAIPTRATPITPVRRK